MIQLALDESQNSQYDTSRLKFLHRPVKHSSCVSNNAFYLEQMLDRPVKVGLVRENTKTYKGGEHVFHTSNPSLTLYIVRSGSVKSYLTTEDGEVQVLGFYLPGDVFGFDGAENETHQASAIALEISSICKFPFTSLSDSGRGRGYPRLLSNQLARDNRLVVLLTKLGADGRVASFLCDFAHRF